MSRSTAPSATPAPFFQPPGAFARDVARRGREAMRTNGADRYADRGVAAAGLITGSVGLAAYLSLLAGLGGGIGALACIAVATIAAYLLVMQLGHDAVHGALSPRRWVNRITVFVVFGLLGVDGAQWRERHVRLHHNFANLPGTGIDADSIEIIRLAPDKRWRPWHRLQPVYAPFLYLLGHASVVWSEDMVRFRPSSLGARGVVTFLAGKALHLSFFVVIPALALRPDPLTLALGYAFASMIAATGFIVALIGNHVSDQVEFPQPGADGAIGHDWATHQVATAVDWSPTSVFATRLTGGNNAHVAHHLFPGHSHCHLPRLARVVIETAAEHGIRYRETSFPGMVAAQWRHIVALSRPPASPARPEATSRFAARAG